MDSRISLKGLTWNHTRGLAPLQVTSKAFSEWYPEVEISWDARSLWSFGEEPIEKVVDQYDLVLIDHPFVGAASALDILAPLDDWTEQGTRQDLKRQSVGSSYDTYCYDGKQWAFPVDAAAQVAVSRQDILDREGIDLPASWEEVIKLAADAGKVAMPMGAMGVWGVFCSLCTNQGEEPFSRIEDKVVSNEMGGFVLNQLQCFFKVIDQRCLNQYPPSLLRCMAETEKIWYMPFTYGYVNYCMMGFIENPLTYHNIFSNSDYGCSGATLGGVGLAITSKCKHKEIATNYATWVAGASCQKSIYAWSGGQAGNVEAWKDPLLNNMTNNFYANTLESLNKAFIRPRHHGFHQFQTQAGKMIQDFLVGATNSKDAIATMNKEYLKSLAYIKSRS